MRAIGQPSGSLCAVTGMLCEVLLGSHYEPAEANVQGPLGLFTARGGSWRTLSSEALV